MDKLLQLLGIDKLNEETQAEVKTKLQDVIDVKAKELSESKIAEEKEALVEKYEGEFEKYKEEITSKFSNFVDSVLDEELTIPQKVLDFAKKGELYHDLIEQFKVRLSVDEGLLDDEVKGLLKEAKEEILKLRGDMDKITEKNLELQTDAQEMAASLYLHEKCAGLTESQRKRITTLLEGIQDTAEIDRKFAIILGEQDDDEEDDDEEDKKKEKKDDEDEDDDDKKTDESKGHAEVNNDDDKTLNEDEDSPFKTFKDSYLQVLKENSIY